MTTRQLQWIAAYSCAVTALILVLGNQSNLQTANAQVGVPVTTPYFDDDADDKPHRQLSDKEACKASDLIGMDVRSAGGDETVGSIDDLVIRHDGRVAYAAVSFGGFLGMGDKLFAVPMEAIEFVKVGEGADADIYARIDVSEQTLKNRQGFDQNNWPAAADEGFLVDSQRVGRAAATRVNQ
jgi:hypothetical protein